MPRVLNELSKISFEMPFVKMQHTFLKSGIKEDVTFPNLNLMICGPFLWYWSLVIAATQLLSAELLSELYILK